MKKKKQKNRLDEMQEQRMLQIEHNGCWLAFWGLIAVIFIQFFFYGPEDRKSITGEWIVFMCLAVYIVAACIRYGIWDRRLSPSPKTNVICSLITGLAGGIFRAAAAYKIYHKPYGAIAAGFVIFFLIFIACFSGLSLVAVLYHKKVDKLENEEENSYEDRKDEEYCEK